MADDRKAYVEDYESDPGSTSGLKRRTETFDTRGGTSPSSRPAKPMERPSQKRRDTVGESIHARRGSKPRVIDSVVPPIEQVATVGQATVKSTSAKPKPIVIQPVKTERRGHQRTQTEPAVMQRPDQGCNVPGCQNPECASIRNTERRYVLPREELQKQRAQAAAQQAQSRPPAAAPAVTFADVPMPPPPPPTAVPRPRAATASRPTRPLSMHGYSAPSIHTSFDRSAYGPPPANSAYFGYPAPNPFDNFPPNMTGTPISPVPQSPPQQGFQVPGNFANVSARTMNPNMAGYEIVRPASAQHQYGSAPTPVLSARQVAPPQSMPRSTYPISREVEYDSYSDSYSDSDPSSEEHYRRRDQHYTRKRDQRESMTISPSRRRPELTKSYTTDALLRRLSVREDKHARRERRSDVGLEYPSSDQFDSDRTGRADVGRRPSTRSSRRPSLATTASSGATKATTMSSASGLSKVIIEDRYGSRAVYMNDAQLARLKKDIAPDRPGRRPRQQTLDDELETRRKTEDIEQYQAQVSGGAKPYELTAENIRRQQKRSGGSHISGSARSHRSAGSKGSKTDGVVIRSGETVLHLYGEAKIEMLPSEDGGPMQLVIGSTTIPATTRDSGYHGSKSSGSGKGREGYRPRAEVVHDDYPR